MLRAHVRHDNIEALNKVPVFASDRVPVNACVSCVQLKDIIAVFDIAIDAKVRNLHLVCVSLSVSPLL